MLGPVAMSWVMAKDARLPSLLTEPIAMLVVGEHDLAAWHELRIAHVGLKEPEHLYWTIKDAQAVVWSEYQDQATLDALRLSGQRLTTPFALDGLAPWPRDKLIPTRRRLDQLAGWFAEQRLLDLIPLGEAPYPSTKDSVRHRGRGIAHVAGVPVHAVQLEARQRQLADAASPQLLEPPSGAPQTSRGSARHRWRAALVKDAAGRVDT